MNTNKQRPLKFRAWNAKTSTMHHNVCIAEDGKVPSAYSSYDWPVMQFTGLHDKEGKEIYEGDLLMGTTSAFISSHMPELKQKPYPVTFENGSFMWRGEPLAWDTESEPVEICLPERWATVIGDIYSSPHLLKRIYERPKRRRSQKKDGER